MVEIWAAFMIYTSPLSRGIHKQFNSEIECWNYYETNGESLFGTQNRDHQNNKPTKGFHMTWDHLNYPIRTYKGLNNNTTVWLTCDRCVESCNQ